MPGLPARPTCHGVRPLINDARPAQCLRELLTGSELLVMPCCFDALSARLVERAGFALTFMSGFAVSAARLATPDTGLISYAEMLDQGRNICAAITIPVIGDGDTGYGNAMNVRRTVRGYAAAGFAGIMIEDQVWPKRCGHTEGKRVVSRSAAESRIQAALDARQQQGSDIVIMARTDARATHGLQEAIDRCLAFREMGADITFLEAPADIHEMQRYCAAVPGPKMANMLEQGHTPILPPAQLQQLGYQIAAYPLTLLSSAVAAMEQALETLRTGHQPAGLKSFGALRELVGFDDYDQVAGRYRE